MDINVFKYLKTTTVEGPGKRFCLWVQGCSRHCKGCGAKSTWSHEKNKIMSVDEIFSIIKQQKDIEGVTFLGGEPFEQAKALSILAKKIKESGLSVVTFTGFTIEELKSSKNEDYQALLNNTDLLIDGHFEESKFDITRPWVGSSNQRYLFLTERYNIDDIKKSRNKIEVRIDKNGFIFVNGMGDFDKIKKDLCLLAKA